MFCVFSCDGVNRVIQTYVDGECDVDTSFAVAAHIERCCGCDDEAANWRALKARLRRQRAEPSDPEAVVRLYAFTALLTRRGAARHTRS
jgi:anti-sigma factor RsiW